MKLYLALANSGGGYVFNNKNPDETMNVLIAGVQSRPYVVKENKELKIYLAGAANGNNTYLHKNNKAIDIFYKDKIFVLESFYYLKEWMYPYILNHWNFMLDSGAFTFLENAKKGSSINWDSYILKYANIINKLNIDHFLELDIDNVVGLKKVEQLRDVLEKETGKKCIPVWHKSRGLEYYKNMCKDYSYVAIGGIVSGEIKSSNYPIFNNLLNIARQTETKVHGLGFTNLEGLTKYPFYSVDSTAWIYGNRGGFLYKFNGKTLIKIHAPQGKRMMAKETAIHNFTEWVKFQKYAEEYL